MLDKDVITLRLLVCVTLWDLADEVSSLDYQGLGNIDRNITTKE